MSLTEIIKILAEGEVVQYAIPIFFILIIVESYIIYKDEREILNLKDSMSSITMGLGSVLFNLIAKVLYFLLFMYLYNHFKIFEIGYQWWAWLILLFADDFSFYWHHRMSHQVRILWAAHSVHHSSEYYNLSTALRQSWTEWSYKYMFWIWLPILGFHPLMIFTMMSISLIYQFFLHTEKVNKLGFLEIFMNTPSHHRVHHGSNVLYLDKNHAAIFIIWDKMFGTFQAELEEEKVIYGLTDNIKTYQPIKIAFIEYLRIYKSVFQKGVSFKNVFQYLINPPGWSHDGSSKTTKELQDK